MVRSIAIALYCVAHASAALSAEANPAARPLAPTTAPAYVSVFVVYQPWQEAKPAPWKGVNEEVGQIGGHAGSVREAKPAPTGPTGSPPAEAKR